MNNRGQAVATINVFLAIFIVLVLGVILFQASAQNISNVRNTQEIVNKTVTLGASNVNSTVTGSQAFQGTITLFNDSHLFATDDFTHVNNNQIVNGALAWTIGATNATLASQDVTITFTSEPDGFSKNSGTRAIVGIILIFFALAIVVISMVPVFKQQILNFR